MSELTTKWPERLKRPWIEDGRELHYERARAEAALERLRVAVEALENIQHQRCYDDDGILHKMPATSYVRSYVEDMLSTIGPLPGCTAPPADRAGG